MALFIICALVALGCLGVSIYFIVSKVKQKCKVASSKTLFLILLGLGFGFALSICGMFLSIYLWANISPKGMELFETIVGSIFFGVFGMTSLDCFVLHYYCKEFDNKTQKKLFTLLMIAFPIMFVFIFVLSDGFADYLTYPIVNGIYFTDSFKISFYALCILSGAIYVYFLCDHKFYIQYGKHGILESTFLIAFPAGIIGARIGYVIGNWTLDGFDKDFWKIFKIWEGGLTILSGAIIGIGVGVLWFVLRKKRYNIWLALDIIVPTILIAQGVGRWGNFFNNEVHGVLIDETYWTWLPKVIFNNMHFSSSPGPHFMLDGGVISEISGTNFWTSGKIFVPLFLIEGITNFLGYFVLAHVFGNALRKKTELGDIGFGYLIWYGLTRTFMEPLRDKPFNMGNDGYWSWMWSLVFVIVGVLAIVINHLVRYLIRKKKDTLLVKPSWVTSSSIYIGIFVLLGTGLLILGISFMANSSFSQTLTFNLFNVGIICLALGISLLLLLIPGIINLIEGIKYKRNNPNMIENKE